MQEKRREYVIVVVQCFLSPTHWLTQGGNRTRLNRHVTFTALTFSNIQYMWF